MIWPYKIEISPTKLNDLGSLITEIEFNPEIVQTSATIDLSKYNNFAFTSLTTFTTPKNLLVNRIESNIRYSTILYCSNFVGSISVKPTISLLFQDANNNILFDFCAQEGQNIVSFEVNNVSKISCFIQFVFPEGLPYQEGDIAGMSVWGSIRIFGETQ